MHDQTLLSCGNRSLPQKNLRVRDGSEGFEGLAGSFGGAPVVTSPSVSIIMATFNRSNVLRYAIQSVLAQTFTDWELLVIGDACTDDTEEVVASFD